MGIENFREGPNTSKETNPEPKKTSGSRDIVKDTSKKLEDFKLEKRKLEKAWKEQKERNEILTRHIKTDNWNQSVERLRAYLKIFQDEDLRTEIHNLPSKNLPSQSEIQEYNSPSQSFQKCLKEGNLEKAREHIEKLKTINEKFQDSLIELGVDPTAESRLINRDPATESRAIDRKNQKLEQEIDKIKPKDVKLSRLTRIKDALIGPHEHRPDRINNITAKFKENVKYIKEQIDGDALPENLKGALIEMTFSVIQDFSKLSAQALHGYGEGSKERQSRREGEARINDINKRIQKIRQDLPMWNFVKKFQDSIKNVPASSSDDTISGIEQLVANKVVDDLKQAHVRVLNCYQRSSDSPLFEPLLQNAYNDLKKSYDQFKILSDHSDKWRKVHEVRVQIKDDFGEATEEDIRVKKLADKEVNRAKDAYKEVLDGYQQSEVGPEHLHGTYKQLEEAGHQLETLRDASHAWKQISEIQTEFVGTIHKKLANKEVKEAKDDFNNFLDRYEQGNNWQISKRCLEGTCKWLKGIVENDLREKWYEEDSFFKTHFEDISKKHNNMEIVGFEEDKQLLKQFFDQSLKQENFTNARKYINQLVKANNYLEELEQHQLPPIPE